MARLGLGVSILSYAGQVRLGIATDSGLVPDPEAIIDDVVEGLEGVDYVREADRRAAHDLMNGGKNVRRQNKKRLDQNVDVVGVHEFDEFTTDDFFSRPVEVFGD